MLFLENYTLELCIYIAIAIIVSVLVYLKTKDITNILFSILFFALGVGITSVIFSTINDYAIGKELAIKNLLTFAPNEKEIKDINFLLKKRFGENDLFTQRYEMRKENLYIYCQANSISFKKDVIERKDVLKKCLLEYQKEYLPNLLEVANNKLTYIDTNDSNSMILIEFPNKRWTRINLFDLIVKKDGYYFHCYPRRGDISCDQLMMKSDENIEKIVQKLLDLKKV